MILNVHIIINSFADLLRAFSVFLCGFLLLYYAPVLSAAPEKVSIQLKWKHSFQFAGYYAAIEQGYYRDAGLDVSLKEAEFSKDFVAQVLNNESEYGVSDSDLLIYHLQGKPVVLINQFFQHSPLVFLSRRESGIVEPKDIINKTLAYNLVKQGDTALKALLSKTVGDLSKIKQKAYGIQSYQDFIDGKIDVISAYSSSQPYLLRQQGVDVNIINPQSYGISFYGDNFFTTEKELEKHPERVAKMSLASKKGWQYALEHPDEIITLIRQKYAAQLSVDHLQYQVRTLRQMILPELIDLGTADPKRYQRIAETYQQLGLTQSSKVMRQFYYQKFKHDSPHVQLSPKEALWLNNHPTVAVGAESDWPPFDFADDKGENIGIARDYLDLIGKKTGLNFDVSIKPWSESLKKLENKQLDLLVAAYYTDDRTQYALYSKPYFKILHYFFVRDDLKVKTIEDLNGKRIAVAKSYATIDIMKEHFPEINIIVEESTEKAIDAVLENRPDMLFDSYAVLSYMLRHRGIQSIIPFKTPRSIVGSSPLHIISRNDSPELASIIQKGLDAVTNSEKQEIYNRWMGATKTNTKKTVHLTEAEQQWLKQNPVVKLAGGDNWPPFDFTNQKGELDGFSYDYIKLIAQKTSLQFEVNLILWTEGLEKIAEGTIDLMMGASFSEQRKKQMTFSQPYFETLNYFFIRDDLNVSSIEDLNGKRVAIPRGWSSDKTIKKYFPKLIVVPVASITDGVEAILENRVDILYDSYAVINYVLKKEGINSIIPFKSSRSQTGTDPLYLISRKNAPHLASILQKGLDAITPEEKIAIQNKWMNDRTFYENNIDLTDKERQWLNEHPSIKLATDLEWAPFEFAGKSGEPEGFTIEILKLIEEKLGIHLNVTTGISWSEILEKIENKELDMTASIAKTAERSKFMLFSKPFFTPTISIFKRNSNEDIFELNSLKGKRIALEKGYYLEELLEKDYPEIQLVFVKHTLAALKQLSHGMVDAYIGNQGVANWLKEQHGLTNLHVVYNVSEFGERPLRFGVRKDWPLLQGLVNKALASIPNDDYLKIRRKWFGSNVIKTVILSAEERRWLDKHKVIRFTGNPNWLPYEGIDKEGNYIGIAAEHLKLIEQRLGIETEFIPTQSWDESVAKVKQGEIDVFSESIDSELKPLLTFTQPYLSSPIVIVMKNNEAYVENIEQIKNRKIALISAYGYTPEIIGHYSEIEFEQVNNVQEGLAAVSTGKVDALFAPLAQASYQISELGMNDIHIVGKTEFTSQFAFAMSAEFKPLVPFFNRALNSISPREKQAFTNLWGKHKFASRIDYVLLAQSITILFVIILGIIYWNRKLAGQIRLRKKAEIALAKSQEQILRFSEEKFFKVFQSSPEIFIILRIADEKIIEVNNTFEQLCGWVYEEVVGKTILELNFWSAEESIAVIGEMKDKGFIRNKDTAFRTKTGDSRIGRTSAERITISGESCFIAIVDDVTDRRQTETALRQSENKFSTAFRSSPYPLFISSLADGVILEVNNAFISLFEYTQVELIGFSDLDLSFWTDLHVRKLMVERLNQLKQVKEMETKVQTKSGGLLYCVFSAEVINLGGKECIINIIQDITQRKQAEDEVLHSRERLRNLANRLEEIREDERIGIARELHDELGQALTGFKIDLIRLTENIPKLKTNQDIVDTMVNNIDSTIDVIRKISSELRPPVLDDLGLESAIEWATRRFSEQTGIKNSINLDCDDMVIDGARDTAVFRIYQEALVNIARHSHAKKIETNVQIVDSVLKLVLKDDGIGITDAQIQDNKSIGLIGMQERAAHIGASISIKNVKSGGTEVNLSVPLVLKIS